MKTTDDDDEMLLPNNDVIDAQVERAAAVAQPPPPAFDGFNRIDPPQPRPNPEDEVVSICRENRSGAFT